MFHRALLGLLVAASLSMVSGCSKEEKPTEIKGSHFKNRFDKPQKDQSSGKPPGVE